MKSLLVISALLGSAFTCISPNTRWQELLAQHKPHMSSRVFEVLSAQQHAFSTNSSPKIADPCIKEIPIIESHESICDINEKSDERIRMLANPKVSFESPDHNSGFPAASKVRISVYLSLVRMLQTLDEQAHHFGYQPGQISIQVFEGLRDLKTQTQLFENKVAEIQKANPSMTHHEATAEASKWVSPVQNNVPVHSTGAAVDIRLWDTKTKKFIDVGPFGVIWGKNDIAPTFSEQCTTEQKKNRLYLLIAAAHAGLTNYSYEHWHFSCGDRYDSYWHQNPGNRYARFGAIL